MGYHQLYHRIYMGSAEEIEEAVLYENCGVVVDLRSMDTELSTKEVVEYFRIPLLEDENSGTQDRALLNAIHQVVTAYKAGKKVAFHCSAGRNRTGSVAIGTLLALGLCKTIGEAEILARQIRPQIDVKGPLKDALLRLFPDRI